MSIRGSNIISRRNFRYATVVKGAALNRARGRVTRVDREICADVICPNPPCSDVCCGRLLYMYTDRCV